MRTILASGRGLLSGWLIAATVPLLTDARAIAAWSATGLWDPFRSGLAGIELLGAALFAFEATVVAGLVLLLGSFVAAALIHVHHYQMPWWLALYALAALVLWYRTQCATFARTG
jgi:hypothetical protein